MSIESSGIISGLISGVLVIIIAAILNRLWHKARKLGEPIARYVLERDCDDCKGAGKVACVSCNGKGSLKKITIERGKCNVCDGLGFITPSCPTCSGSGITFRRLRFEDRGAQGRIEQRGILWWAKRFQIVTVSMRNSDDKAGTFSGSVRLQDGNRTTKQGEIFLRPGEIGQIGLEFGVGNNQGYPTEYDIAPEQMQFSCTICSGTGKIQKACNACQGLGEIPAQKEISESCNSCAGSGQTTCNTCRGTGKVRRI